MTTQVNPLRAMSGRVMRSVNMNVDRTELVFEADDGLRFRFYHKQDCCERVVIEDIVGELEDLVGAPILVAEETIGLPPAEEVLRRLGADQPNDDSWTWTFYRFATIRGTVTVRWYGSSNGYYSEKVDFSVER